MKQLEEELARGRHLRVNSAEHMEVLVGKYGSQEHKMTVIGLETIHHAKSSESSATSQGSQWRSIFFFFNVYLLHQVLVATHRIFTLH